LLHFCSYCVEITFRVQIEIFAENKVVKFDRLRFAQKIQAYCFEIKMK